MSCYVWISFTESPPRLVVSIETLVDYSEWRQEDFEGQSLVKTLHGDVEGFELGRVC